MCGITGVIGIAQPSVGRGVVVRMNREIIHRGPDDEGIFATENFAFGCRRLSVIDLEGGHQPIFSKSGCGIVFNGEVYNYRELRREMLARGVHFQTKSDTEVVLNLYEDVPFDEWLKSLEGMFALCIYDPRKNQVHLVRDSVGIKPLYYGSVNGRFYFASEIKSIISVLEKKPGLNKNALHHYLTLRYVPAPETIWEGIFKLEAGHCLTYKLSDNTFSINRYSVLMFDSKKLSDKRDYPDEFEKLFLNSVEKHLITSDVPVGVMLSGGLDSSAVAAAAVEMGHKNFHTFNVSFSDGGEFSEARYARQTAQYIGASHHEIVIGQKEFMDFIPRMVWYTDEPLADLSSVPLYYVSKLARQYVKVVLTGEGSDEIFAGYDIELLARRLDILHLIEKVVPHSFLKAVGDILQEKSAMGIIFRTLADYGWSNYLKGRITHITHYWSEGEKRELWRALPYEVGDTDGLIRGWYSDAASKNPIDQLQQVYCRSWLVEDLLMKADRMSMANSLELRVPFLYKPLMEWAAELPLQWKVGGGKVFWGVGGYVSKRILREFALRKNGRLPPSIVQRPKQGFPVPAYKWLMEDKIAHWVEDTLGAKDSFVRNFFDYEIIMETFSEARRGAVEASAKLWILVIFEHWCRRWML